MGIITEMAGAVRAGLGMVRDDMADRIVELENDVDRLQGEREALLERLERAVLNEREVVSRHGGRPGERLDVFVARISDAFLDRIHALEGANNGLQEDLRLSRRRVGELEAQQRDEVTEEWDRSAKDAEMPIDLLGVCCRTCDGYEADAPGRQPGATGLCRDLVAINQSAVLGSIYNPGARPRSCPGWR